MSSIDQVIARARHGDVAFAERKQFKLARRRAIEKLRRFALADPYFYVLEIIQAAIAGGADYVDISCGHGDVLISWTGGVVREDELAQLFDFLFASKDRLDLAHVRSLALGVNALMLFEPEQVVIESGDGRPGGTTRMVVRAGAEQVDVGRAEGQLAGTYVRATRLNRDKVAAETGRRGDDDGGLEYATVELRCLAAPVPLVFNGQPLFGWSKQRVPNLYGYRQVRSFDEGDLYGSIGTKPIGGEASFQLLTHGVWVQSYQYEFMRHHKFGGVICFDRLHKTVDHSGFVRDERFAEMWIRVRPYAEALIGGKPLESSRITTADGLEYTPAELREFLRAHPRIVILPPERAAAATPNTAPQRGTEEGGATPTWRAKTIARMLDAELLRVADTQVPAVRVLGDRNLLIWRPHLDDATDQRFYNQPELEPPPPPYLLPPAELEPPTRDTLIDELLAVDERPALGDWANFLGTLGDAGLLDETAKQANGEEARKRQLQVMLGETGTIAATLYSPVDPGDAAGGLLVRVTAARRSLGQWTFATAYPGRILDVDLPTAQPAAMLRRDTAALVAERFAARTGAIASAQDQRALAGLGVGKIEPDTPAARLALQVLARVTVTRLRAARPAGQGRAGGRLRPGLSFSLLRPSSGFDPYELRLLRTVSGIELSLRELALMADETGGLIYGTIPEVPADLDGLDPDSILALDASSERTLISLLGEAGYVRIDARDVIASAEGLVVRDVALGLREYPDFPLLLEGEVEVLDELDEQARDDLLSVLLAGLRARMLGEADEPGGDPLELEEHRRQAVRHLQWYVCREYARRGPEPLERRGLVDLPLFCDLDGEVWALRQVVDALRSAEGLLVHYGHTLGQAELGSITAAARAGRRAPSGRPGSLALSCFVYRLLVPLGRVRLAFDFDLDDVEAARNPMTSSAAFLVEDRFADAWGTGVLGIPATRLAEYRVQLRERTRGAVAALDEIAHLYGVVGSIELSRARLQVGTSDAIIAAVDQRAGALLERLIATLAAIADDPRRYEAALRVLLTYAGEQLTLIADEAGLSTRVSTPLATRILGLPLFDVGAATLVSGQRMLERFRREFERQLYEARDGAATLQPIAWSQVVVESSPAVVREWLDAHLQPSAVIMPPSSRGQAPTPATPGAHAREDPVAWDPSRALGLDVLAWNLEHWLEQLRPDPRDRPATRVWIVPQELPSGGLIDGGDGRVNLWAWHPLVTRVSAAPTPSNFAWLLLATYALINANSTMVSNAHEARFHVIVGEALVAGRLRVLEPIERAR